MMTDAKLRTLKYKRLESKGTTNAGQLLHNRHPDKDGMYVSVSPAGTISFRYDFRWPRSAKGKRQCITYGQYPATPLASFRDARGQVIEGARDLHLDALRKLRDGINPLEQRRAAKQAATQSSDNTFQAVAERWYKKAGEGKSTSWLEANRRYLDVSYPRIGQRAITGLTARDISSVITPIEESGRRVTADKARQCYAMVFDYAVDKPEFLKLQEANPARAISIDLPETQHHAHLEIDEVPDFLKAVDADAGPEQVRLAVRLLFLTLTRKMELVGAKWEELDLEAARWLIPATRMKGKKPHIVPLSNQATALFRRLKEIANGSEWVFPALYGTDKHMSSEAVNAVFKRTGYKGKATPHGCRSTASSTLNELGYSAEHIEKQLAHNEQDEVRAAYLHTDFMPARRKLLQDWADAIDRKCAGLPLVHTADNVVAIGSAKAA